MGSFSEEKRRQRFFTDMNFDLWVFIVESLKAGNSHIFYCWLNITWTSVSDRNLQEAKAKEEESEVFL